MMISCLAVCQTLTYIRVAFLRNKDLLADDIQILAEILAVTIYLCTVHIPVNLKEH